MTGKGWPVGREGERSEIAALFQQHSSGDRAVLPALVSSVREELRRAARELDSSGDHPARALASLSALYVRVATQSGLPLSDHPSFFGISAAAMRRAVVEYMREDGVRDGLTGTELIGGLDAALARVESINERLARVVECRYFGGLSEAETSGALGIDLQSVTRDWTRARGWLLRDLANTTIHGHDSPVPNASWVDAVLDDALALAPGKLEPFLDRCSAAPGELRARVEELLHFSSAAVPRFEPGDLSTEFLFSVLRATADDDSMTVRRLGAPHPLESAPPVPAHGSTGWRIIRELRHGRLGPLYLAERPDRPSWPKGALRFVRGETSLAAFRRRPDWRILSSLTHAGIARLLEAGRTDDGRLFIVSEHLDGTPIDRYCDEQLLTIEARLALFLKACRAVQYGHRKLAIHGGMSPSNVIVTADGEVKLLDFGVAGLLATGEPDGHEAETSSALRPPAFASPEQLRGEALGVASDVYQLGLLLHMLLTGARPTTVPVRPSLAVLRTLEESAPARNARSRALVRKLRGDLDAIVMHALRREPERRYASVSLLRSDIHCYLERRPVMAQGDRRSYRFKKFLVRRSVPVAASVILATLGIAALPGFVRGRVRASAEPAPVAEVEQLLGNMFAPRATASGLNPPSVLHVEQAARLARVELAGKPESQSRLFTKIGRTLTALGFYERSIAILEEALALRRSSAGDDSLDVAETLEALGESRHRLARFDEAESDLRAVIAIREVRLGATHPDALSAAVTLGDLLHSRGQFLEAERLLRGAVTSLRPEMAGTSADAPVGGLLPRTLASLASVIRDRGALGEAAVLYREANSILEQGEAAPEQVAAVRVDFSMVLLGRAELDRAEAELEPALETLRRAYPDEHPTLAVALREYGSLRLEQGRLDEAQELLTEALRMQELWLGRMHPLVPRTRALLAELARRRGQTAEAVMLATSALKDFERMGMADHPWTLNIRATLADALIALSRDDEALGVLTPALTSAPRVFVSYDARLTRLQAAHARASRRQPEYRKERGATGSAP